MQSSVCDPTQTCIQPNGWSCYPTAVSYLTGVPFQDLIREIGHDGSRIVFDDRAEPRCREAFCQSEMALALWSFGWALSPVYAAIEHGNGTSIPTYPTLSEISDRIEAVCSVAVAVVKRDTGLHCFAWHVDRSELRDPSTGDIFKTGFPVDIPVVSIECLFRIS